MNGTTEAMAAGRMPARARRTAALTLATAVLFLILIQPNHPAAMTWGALRLFPLELPAILLALLVLPARGVGIAFRVVLVAVLMAIAVLKLADYATFVAYNRGFNLVVDLHLIPAAWNLASGSSGALRAGMVLGAGLAAVAGVTAALWWATGVWARLHLPGGVRTGAAVLFVPAAALAVAEIGQARRAWVLPFDPPGAAFTARVGWERVQTVRATLRDLADFRAAAQADTFAGAGPLFDRLGAADLVIVYVESYGRASMDNPLYAPTHEATLREIEASLAERGLAMRSGWARAPMTGGQSWLAHASVAAGMWIANQGRYRALLASPRRTLFHFAQAAGRRTVAIKPAHVFDWPEGDFFGFDAIYNAPDLGYAGERFNWVTMPDQFVLHAFDRLERAGTPGADRPPMVAQIALISSHAPFLPVPPVIDWDEIGDGTVFNQWASIGDPPDVVWRDHDRVREKYRLAVDYSLRATGAWVERNADAPALLVVLGDHQAARFIAGVDGYDVPVHVVGPPELVALVDGWGWTDGMIPDAALPVWPMDRLRDAILRATSSGAP